MRLDAKLGAEGGNLYVATTDLRIPDDVHRSRRICRRTAVQHLSASDTPADVGGAAGRAREDVGDVWTGEEYPGMQVRRSRCPCDCFQPPFFTCEVSVRFGCDEFYEELTFRELALFEEAALGEIVPLRLIAAFVSRAALLSFSFSGMALPGEGLPVVAIF